jgi:hypothetical protein
MPMTDTGYLVWLIAMAVLTTTVLTVGTLGAADLLPHQRRAQARQGSRDSRPTGGTS